ncbi:MAG: hypothetical protein ACOC2W_04455 [bacterium]
MIKNYNNFLLEGKQVGNLYHIVDLEKIFYILENNKIKNYHFNFISTTRDKMLNHYVGDSPTSIFKLELDGNKLSNRFKIKPFVYKSITDISFYEEKEEVIKTNEIKNVMQYVNRFILNKNRLESLKESGWFSSDGGNFMGKRKTIPELLGVIWEKIKEYGKELYIQDGHKIYKDDNYIMDIINYDIEQINHGYALYLRGYDKELIKGKYESLIDVLIPIDKRNDKIRKFVIGYEYENLWLSKDNRLDYSDIEVPEKFKLYLCDFIYNNEDVIREDSNFIYLKKAKLHDIDWKI